MKKFFIFILLFFNFYSFSAEINIGDQFIASAKDGNFDQVKNLSNNATLEHLKEALKETQKIYLAFTKTFEEGGLKGNVLFQEQEALMPEYEKIIDYLNCKIKKRQNKIYALFEKISKNKLPRPIIDIQLEQLGWKKTPSIKIQEDPKNEFDIIYPSHQIFAFESPAKQENIQKCPDTPDRRKRRKLN